jgi:hypothetical protein
VSLAVPLHIPVDSLEDHESLLAVIDSLVERSRIRGVMTE